MPTGQLIGEPKVEYVRDDTVQLATVRVTGLPRRHAAPRVVVHRPARHGAEAYRADAPLRLELHGVDHAGAAPACEVSAGDAAGADAVTITGVCLRRCADEPGRMSDADVEHHALHMAVLALQDRMAQLRLTAAERARQIAEHEAHLEKLRRPV